LRLDIFADTNTVPLTPLLIIDEPPLLVITPLRFHVTQLTDELGCCRLRHLLFLCDTRPLTPEGAELNFGFEDEFRFSD
jgi:hypothetical protein